MSFLGELLATLGKRIIKRMPNIKPKIEQAPAAGGNYTPGRKGDKIEYIVIHVMQGTLKGTTKWFAMPEAEASAHYSIGFDGNIVQHVQDTDTAWHAGNGAYNRRSIGIELEGFIERGYFPDMMMGSLAKLILYLAKEYNVEVSRQRIIGHNEVPSPDGTKMGGAGGHTDPGPKFPWGVLMELLNNGKGAT